MNNVKTAVIAAATSVVMVFLLHAARAVAGPDLGPDSTFNLVPYEGTLELNGVLYSGAADLVARLYPSATATTPVYVETLRNVAVSNGRFATVLGREGQDAGGAAVRLSDVVASHPELHIGFDVATAGGSAMSLDGRQRLLATPFSITPRMALDLWVQGVLTAQGTLHALSGVKVVGGVTGTNAADGSTGPLTMAGTTVDVTGGPVTVSGTTVNLNATSASITAQGALTLQGTTTLRGPTTMESSATFLGPTVVPVNTTSYASGSNTTPEAYPLNVATAPSCTRGQIMVGRANGSSGQDSFCVCMLVNTVVQWWCFNP